MIEPKPENATFADGSPSTAETHTATPAAITSIFPIIAVLAAGNRQALETFCQTLPDETGLAFIVVTPPSATARQLLSGTQADSSFIRLRPAPTEAPAAASFAVRV